MIDRTIDPPEPRCPFCGCETDGGPCGPCWNEKANLELDEWKETRK